MRVGVGGREGGRSERGRKAGCYGPCRDRLGGEVSRGDLEGLNSHRPKQRLVATTPRWRAQRAPQRRQPLSLERKGTQTKGPGHTCKRLLQGTRSCWLGCRRCGAVCTVRCVCMVCMVMAAPGTWTEASGALAELPGAARSLPPLDRPLSFEQLSISGSRLAAEQLSFGRSQKP